MKDLVSQHQVSIPDHRLRAQITTSRENYSSLTIVRAQNHVRWRSCRLKQPTHQTTVTARLSATPFHRWKDGQQADPAPDTWPPLLLVMMQRRLDSFAYLNSNDVSSCSMLASSKNHSSLSPTEALYFLSWYKNRDLHGLHFSVVKQ